MPLQIQVCGRPNCDLIISNYTSIASHSCSKTQRYWIQNECTFLTLLGKGLAPVNQIRYRPTFFKLVIVKVISDRQFRWHYATWLSMLISHNSGRKQSDTFERKTQNLQCNVRFECKCRKRVFLNTKIQSVPSASHFLVIQNCLYGCSIIAKVCWCSGWSIELLSSTVVKIT